MKKSTLSLLTVLFGVMLVIFACRRELDSFVSQKTPDVPPDLLESAKIWNAKVLGQTSKSIVKTKDWINLKPIWNDAWSFDSPQGIKYIVAPTVEPNVSNRAVNVRRVFVFESMENQIGSGKIIEFIGLKTNINDKLDRLIAFHRYPHIEGFTGAIIQYDLDYRWISGSLYENGDRTNDNVSVLKALVEARAKDAKSTEKPTVRSDMYLRVFKQDSKGLVSSEKMSYLFTPSKMMSTQSEGGGSGSGGGSGDGSGSQLEDVVIVGTGGGGTGGGGGGVPIGGNLGGGTPGGGSGGGGGGGSLTLSYINNAVLCMNIPMTKVGNSYTAGVSKLGFVATIIDPVTESTTEVNVIFAVTCITIPDYNTNAVNASIAFVTAYNAAVKLIETGLKSRKIPSEGNTIKAALLVAVNAQLNLYQLGSLMTTSQCQGISQTQASYCP